MKKKIAVLSIAVTVFVLLSVLFLVVLIPTLSVKNASLDEPPYNYDTADITEQFLYPVQYEPVSSMQEAKKIAWDVLVTKFGYWKTVTELPFHVVYDAKQEAWLVSGTFYGIGNGGTGKVLIQKDGSVAVWHEK